MNKFSKVLLSSVVIGGLLAGCSAETANQEPKEEPKQAEQKKVENPKKDESGRVVLEKVGQVTTDENATAELMKIKKVNEVIDLHPIKITIEDIKLIKLTNINESLKEEISFWAERPAQDSETYVQINFKAENVEEKNVGWNGFDNIVTDKKEQIYGGASFIWETMDTEFMGKVIQKDTVGYVLKPGMEDINSIKIISGDSYDLDTIDTLTAAQEVTYTFE